jgi:hypothetical protein
MKVNNMETSEILKAFRIANFKIKETIKKIQDEHTYKIIHKGQYICTVGIGYRNQCLDCDRYGGGYDSGSYLYCSITDICSLVRTERRLGGVFYELQLLYSEIKPFECNSGTEEEFDKFIEQIKKIESSILDFLETQIDKSIGSGQVI